MVLSIIAYSLSASAAKCSNRRCHTPLLGPAAEPSMGVLPIPESLWQVAPGNSRTVSIKHRLDESAIIPGRGPDIADFSRQHVLDSLPLIIAQSISGHGSACFCRRPSIIHINRGAGRLFLRLHSSRRLALLAIAK